MAVYKHGVYVTEQPTGVVAPVQSTAGLQVVIGTAPINRASDPYHCTNTPMLANTLKGATAAVGYSNDYDKYTICQSMGACFKVMGVAPVILINVLDPNKHKKDMAETTVQVNSGVATVEQKDILLDKLVVKSASTTLTAGTDYTAAFDDDGYPGNTDPKDRWFSVRRFMSWDDKSLGYAYKGLRIVEIGRVKEFTPGKIKAGEGMEAKVKLELTYLMIENDGEEIIAIDKLNGIYRVQGEDMLADVAALI